MMMILRWLPKNQQHLPEISFRQQICGESENDLFSVSSIFFLFCGLCGLSVLRWFLFARIVCTPIWYVTLTVTPQSVTKIISGRIAHRNLWQRYFVEASVSALWCTLRFTQKTAQNKASDFDENKSHEQVRKSNESCWWCLRKMKTKALKPSIYLKKKLHAPTPATITHLVCVCLMELHGFNQ